MVVKPEFMGGKGRGGDVLCIGEFVLVYQNNFILVKFVLVVIVINWVYINLHLYMLWLVVNWKFFILLVLY